MGRPLKWIRIHIIHRDKYGHSERFRRGSQESAGPRFLFESMAYKLWQSADSVEPAPSDSVSALLKNSVRCRASEEQWPKQNPSGRGRRTASVWPEWPWHGRSMAVPWPRYHFAPTMVASRTLLRTIGWGSLLKRLAKRGPGKPLCAQWQQCGQSDCLKPVEDTLSLADHKAAASLGKPFGRAPKESKASMANLELVLS